MKKLDAEIFDCFFADIACNDHMFNLWKLVVEASISTLTVHEGKNFSKLGRNKSKGNKDQTDDPNLTLNSSWIDITVSNSDESDDSKVDSIMHVQLGLIFLVVHTSVDGITWNNG